MNTSRLLQFVDYLLKEEARLALQDNLNKFSASLANLVAQPQAPTHQTAVAENLGTTEEAFIQFERGLTPAQSAALAEIGATNYFSSSVVSSIKSTMANNPLTPAVVQQNVTRIINERSNYLASLTNAQTSLKSLNVGAETLPPGTAEIGFLIPRDLFNNRLDQLVKELRDINLIIRHFSEVVTGKIEEATVHQISTSNPIFFFGLEPATIAAIGASITWLLNTWKQALDIKKKYNELKQLGIDDDILTQIEANVTKKIEKSIQERATELFKQYGGKDSGRKNELEAGLKQAMHALMARIERGLLVEVHSLPPSKPKADAADDAKQAYEADTRTFTTLTEIAKGLDFPAVEGDPMLVIPQLKAGNGISVESHGSQKSEPKSETKKKS